MPPYSPTAAQHILEGLASDLAVALNGKPTATEPEVRALLKGILLSRRNVTTAAAAAASSTSVSPGRLYRDSFVLIFNNGATYIELSSPRPSNGHALEHLATPCLSVSHDRPPLSLNSVPLTTTEGQSELRSIISSLAPYLSLPEGDNNTIGHGGNEHEYYPAGSCPCPSNEHNQPNRTYNKNAFIADGRAALSITVSAGSKSVIGDLLNYCNELRARSLRGEGSQFQYSPI